MHKSNKGFSLVELSIVMVIIGLIVGSVTAGRSLVNSARLQRVMSDVTQVQGALISFKEQYNALAGDMKTASSVWTGAVNGLGLGSWDNGGNGWDMTTNTQNFTLWQHLSLAKLIRGNYTGVAGSGVGGGGNVPGVNVPKLATGDLDSLNAYFGNDWNYFPQWNALQLIKANPWTPATPTISAYNMDLKMDDGKPYTGRVVAYSGGSTPPCLNSGNFASGYANTPALRAAISYDFPTGGTCEVKFAVFNNIWQ